MQQVIHDYNSKSTYQIIHSRFEFMLQTTEQIITSSLKVEIGPPNPNNKRQLWLIEQCKGDGFEIINGVTDHVLTEDGISAILKRGKSSRHQNWTMIYIRDHQCRIKLTHSKDKYLCAEGGVVKVAQLQSQTLADTWILREVKDNKALNLSCFIRSSDTGKLIDVPEASSKEALGLVIWQPNYRFNQRWNVHRSGEIFIIKSFFNRMNIDVATACFEDGAKIIQYPSNGQINQFWRMERIGDESDDDDSQEETGNRGKSKEKKERQHQKGKERSPHKRQVSPEKKEERKRVYRVYTCFDSDLELGHNKEGKLILHKGRKYTWEFQGHLPF